MSLQNCPYCDIAFRLDGVDHDYSFPHFGNVGRRIFAPPSSNSPQPSKSYRITSHLCPNCAEQIMWLTELVATGTEREDDGRLTESIEEGDTTLLFPKRRQKLIAAEIPEPFASEFSEAFFTLEISPKASAALSRRCLQRLIREKEGIEQRTLFDEVSELLATNTLPKHLADELDAIRNVGNFAAHPLKDTDTGVIVPVNPAEAEWTLSVLEQLLHFYFVEIPASEARRKSLNEKLQKAGKLPML